MSTNLNFAFVSGTGGPLLRIENDTTLTATRIRGVHATGVGVFTVDDVIAGTATTKIKFVNTTADDKTEMYLTDCGVRFDGTVVVSAPTTASSFTAIYG